MSIVPQYALCLNISLQKAPEKSWLTRLKQIGAWQATVTVKPNFSNVNALWIPFTFCLSFTVLDPLHLHLVLFFIKCYSFTLNSPCKKKCPWLLQLNLTVWVYGSMLFLLHCILCPHFFLRWKEMFSKIWFDVALENSLSVFTCCQLIILWFVRGVNSHSIWAIYIQLLQDFNYCAT